MIVVDTNILAYHVIRGGKSAATERLVRLDPDWAAPLLWRSELRNVLAGSMRHGLTTAAEAERCMAHAAGCLLGGEHAVSDHAVLELVAQSRCTAYDCEFVALALALGTRLVTDDRAILQAFPRHCRSLDDLAKSGA